MAGTKPIPVRLESDLVERIDKVAAQIGSNRAAIIRLCAKSFVDHFDKAGKASLPVDWDELLQAMDGRTSIARAAAKRRKKR